MKASCGCIHHQVQWGARDWVGCAWVGCAAPALRVGCAAPALGCCSCAGRVPRAAARICLFEGSKQRAVWALAPTALLSARCGACGAVKDWSRAARVHARLHCAHAEQ